MVATRLTEYNRACDPRAAGALRATPRCSSRPSKRSRAPLGLGFRPISTAVPRGSARVC